MYRECKLLIEVYTDDHWLLNRACTSKACSLPTCTNLLTFKE
jgi:hypothetical protein